MKSKFTLLFVLLGLIKYSAQTTVLNESFSAPFNLISAGWEIQNNSIPLGTLSWFQGNSVNFVANTGSPTDYYAANYQSQGNTTGGISNFLITPTVTLVNGGVISFATRTTTNPANFADRLQLLMSQGTGTGAIGSGTSSVGTFTTLLFSVNPNLTATGYPGTWTVYSTTLTGITAPAAGRFAFRYFVENGGSAGTNSDYIGLDDVLYTTPTCNTPTLTVNPVSASVCTGNSVNLSVTGASSYTWSSGSVGASVNVTPSTSAVYTVSGSTSPFCVGSQTVLVNVVSPPTISATNASICANASATLSASGASTYSWSNGSTGSSIVVSPNSNTTYTVIGSNGTCSSSTVVSVSVVAALVISATNASICPNGNATLTASGASSYNWSNGFSGSSIVVSPNTNTTYTVTGQSGSCSGYTTVMVTIVPNPTISVSDVTVCPNAYATLTVSGASTYSWSTGATSSSIIIAPSSNTTYTVVGINGPNCYNVKTVTAYVSSVISVANVTTCPNTPVTIVASGALIYNWSNGATTSSIIVTPTANATYSITGNNGACSETKTVSVTINPNLSVSNMTTCAGTAATLTANGATSYTWSNGSNSSFVVVTPTTNTTYTVIGSNGTCSDTKTVSVTIGNNLSVNASGACVGSTLILTANGASSYTWLPSGGNAPSIIITPTASSIYTVNGASGSCLGTQTVLASYCAGIENYSLSNNAVIIAYPNPFNSELTISGANGYLQIINSLGQVIIEQTISEQEIINTSELSSGFYFIRITNSNGNVVKKINAIKN